MMVGREKPTPMPLLTITNPHELLWTCSQVLPGEKIIPYCMSYCMAIITN
jgi:hypothetical protein